MSWMEMGTTVVKVAKTSCGDRRSNCGGGGRVDDHSSKESPVKGDKGGDRDQRTATMA